MAPNRLRFLLDRRWQLGLVSAALLALWAAVRAWLGPSVPAHVAVRGELVERVVASGQVMPPMDLLVVLADEPNGNLDGHPSDAVFAMLRKLNLERGTTFLVVTHDKRLAERCDRIVGIVDGRIVADRPNPLARGPEGHGEPHAG